MYISDRPLFSTPWQRKVHFNCLVLCQGLGGHFEWVACHCSSWGRRGGCEDGPRPDPWTCGFCQQPACSWGISPLSAWENSPHLVAPFSWPDFWLIPILSGGCALDEERRYEGSRSGILPQFAATWHQFSLFSAQIASL